MTDVSAPAAVEGERHVSAVAGRGGFDRKKGAMLVACAAGAAVAFVLLRPQGPPHDPNKVPDDRLQVRQVARYEPPPLPLPTPVAFAIPRPPEAAPPPLPVQTTPMPGFMQQAPADPLLKARHAPLFAYSTNAGANGTVGPEGGNGAVTPAAALGQQPTELAARLQATPVGGVSANVLRHQPYLLTQGNVLPCVLQTAMDSTLPGFVTCVVPQDITGKTGITLLDRGTKVVGEFQGGMRQGQARLFVLWTRAETPNGVVINLASPGTDPLGRSGFSGELDTHFWARFGGALLLSFVDGALQAGVAAASPSGSTTISTGGVESVAGESLRNSANIAPTLRKNQGELVSIFVARDLDFSTVYRVRTTGAP
jgi:type IV secretion system protein VirB10